MTVVGGVMVLKEAGPRGRCLMHFGLFERDREAGGEREIDS